MKKIIAAWGLLSGVLLSAAQATTPLRVCTIPLPPQTMQDREGKPDGYATRILEATAKRLQWTLDIQYMPWARLVVESKAGRCDVIYTVLKRADYEEYMVFPKVPVLDQVDVLVVRRDSGIRYSGDLEDFMLKHSIGLYRDKAVDNRFEQLRRAPWARVEEATTATQNMQKLLAGRFQAAIENNLTAAYELRTLGGLEAVDMLEPPLNVTPAYIAFPKAGRLNGDTSAFDEALSVYKRSEEFKLLERRYLGRAH